MRSSSQTHLIHCLITDVPSVVLPLLSNLLPARIWMLNVPKGLCVKGWVSMVALLAMLGSYGRSLSPWGCASEEEDGTLVPSFSPPPFLPPPCFSSSSSSPLLPSLEETGSAPHTPTMMCYLATGLKEQVHLRPPMPWAKPNFLSLKVAYFKYR